MDSPLKLAVAAGGRGCHPYGRAKRRPDSNAPIIQRAWRSPWLFMAALVLPTMAHADRFFSDDDLKVLARIVARLDGVSNIW